MYLNSNQRLPLTQKEIQNQLTIECNNNNIPLSHEVKLLGEIIDNKLTFEPHIKNICKNVNTKTHLLNKSLYLFTETFKPILFKLFIQSRFDYCSTLILHHSNKNNKDRLTKCFKKSIDRILKIRLYTLNTEQQFHTLNDLNILPLELRHFFRFSTFLFSTVKNNNTLISKYLNKNLSLTKTRNKYLQPKHCKSFFKFSFISISIKLLNHFISSQIDNNANISTFKSHLLKKIKTLFLETERFWN